MPTSGALPRFSIHLSERIASKKRNLNLPKLMALYCRQMNMLLASITYIMSVLSRYVISLLSYPTSSQWPQSFEYEFDISPAWRFVATHFRWTPRLQSIADGYLRRIFKVPDNDPIPPVSENYLSCAIVLINVSVYWHPRASRRGLHPVLQWPFERRLLPFNSCLPPPDSGGSGGDP